MRISVIAALARNRVIGRGGTMPWHLPAELKHFKSVTMGKPIVMGRKTFDSIGRPLPGRRNIVVTRDLDYYAPGIEVAHGLDQALEMAAGAGEIMVIGGGELYRQALPFAWRLYLTYIDAEIEGDTFFPQWDPSEWVEIERTDHPPGERNAYAMTFVVLERQTRRSNGEPAA